MAKITEVRVRKLYDEGMVKSIVSVTIDDAFAVHGIKVLENESGLFISMPAKKLREGDFKDIFHPINAEARRLIQDAVLGAYKLEVDKVKEEKKHFELVE